VNSTGHYIFSGQKIGWTPTTSTCSIMIKGHPQVWETIESFLELTKSNDYFYKKRSEQDMADETINEQIKLHFTIILKFSNA
jgi:LAO/AO transport system kinase